MVAHKGSIVLTADRGFSHWGQVFADQVVAAAVVDRLLHDATVVNIRGRSYQMRAHAEESKMEKMVPG